MSDQSTVDEVMQTIYAICPDKQDARLAASLHSALIDLQGQFVDALKCNGISHRRILKIIAAASAAHLQMNDAAIREATP